ncbi:TPA: DNA topoisomerase [Acinetobacter nosocomialis]
MSAQNLVIVESKNKVSKVQTYLDQLYGKSSFIVSYSSGHIRDLPTDSFGLTENYTPTYVFSDGGARRVAELKKLAVNAQNVYLATDDDREGEAIAWHLQTVLKCKERAFRVAFNEITKAALKSTFDNPRSLNMKIVAAQEARRFLDRIIGYVGTPVFTVLCGERQIAGRVQSSIVVYLADLERQIQSFVSVHHFGVSFLFDEWTANWETENFVEKSNPYFMDRGIAEKIALLKNFNVISFEEKPVKSSPPAPFTTPTYLRAAQVQCKLKPKEAMKIAQKLFEDGHITYHRTDSPNISDDAFSMIQAFALKHKLPVLTQVRKFKAKKNAQEGHEAIRPTDINISKISEDPVLQQVYQMIWLRAVASQMEEATYTSRSVRLVADQKIENRDVFIKATGRKLIDQGWLRLTAKTSFSENEQDDIKEDEQELNNPVPLLAVGADVRATSGQVNNKSTQPPRRHTEASLIKFMEDSDIGRPSTYAVIVSKIIEHGYVVTDNKNKLHATDLAMRLSAKVADKFDFCNLTYTAGLEGQLDLIAHGENISQRLLKEAHQTILAQAQNASKLLEQDPNTQYCSKCQSALVLLTGASQKTYFKCSNLACGHNMKNENGKAIDKEDNVTPFNCVECSKSLIIMNGAKGKFFGCSGFFNKRNKCRASYPMLENGEPDFAQYAKRKEQLGSQSIGSVDTPKTNVATVSSKSKDHTCPECNKTLSQKTGKRSTDGKKWEMWICECGSKYWGARNKPDFSKKVSS